MLYNSKLEQNMPLNIANRPNQENAFRVPERLNACRCVPVIAPGPDTLVIVPLIAVDQCRDCASIMNLNKQRIMLHHLQLLEM